MHGPYAGELAEVDHIVPRAHALELENEIANLELLPSTLNRRKGAKIGRRQLDYARRFHAAGLLNDASLRERQIEYMMGFRDLATVVFSAFIGGGWFLLHRKRMFKARALTPI